MADKMAKKEKSFYARDSKEWRAWLEKNHAKEKSVQLIKYKKHTGMPSLTNREAMDDAICFGWIDTTIRRVDEKRYCQKFVPRNKNSKWSDNTVARAKQLIKEGRMTPVGIHWFNEGLKKPTHDYELPKDPDMPPYMKKALKEKGVLSAFNAIAPSYRKTYIRWIIRARQPATIDKRINTIAGRIREKRKHGIAQYD